MDGKKRVCVIGAGAGGLITIRGLQSLEKDKFEVICYKKSETLGGLWNTSVKRDEGPACRMEKDEDGNFVAKYPKEMNELPDHLHSEDLKISYLPSEKMQEYLENYADKYGLQNRIQFGVSVEHVSFDEKDQKFIVQSKGKKDCVEKFDYVLVATGHFAEPNIVKYPGEESFPGSVIHAKFFKNAPKYHGQKVLLVGSGISAEEVALKLLKIGAQKITISRRSTVSGIWNYPEGIDTKPGLVNIEGSSVNFSDGSSCEYDSIIYCTGYKHFFPFMEEKLRLDKMDKRLAAPLYKGVLFPNNHKLMYIGMQHHLYTFTRFWLQGKVCAKIIAGEMELPGVEEMEKEIECQQNEEALCKDVFDQADFQTKYMNGLSDLTGEVKLDASKIAYQWAKDRMESIATFTERSFASIHRP